MEETEIGEVIGSSNTRAYCVLGLALGSYPLQGGADVRRYLLSGQGDAFGGELRDLTGGQSVRPGAHQQAQIAGDGVRALPSRLEWLTPGRTTLLASHVFTWESDPWAQGGYAVFRPSYDPALRSWLAGV